MSYQVDVEIDLATPQPIEIVLGASSGSQPVELVLGIPSGPPGATGPTGPPPHIVGTLATSADLPNPGALGEIYLVTDTRHGWQWFGGAWTDVGVMVGAPGAQGAAGAAGAAGAQGAAGQTPDVSNLATTAALAAEVSRAGTAEGLAAQKSANLSDLADPAEARSNLSLGDSATKDVGTTAGTVAAGDDSRFGTGGADPQVANTLTGNATGMTARPTALTPSQAKAMLSLTTSDVSGLGTAATHSANDFDAAGTAAAAQVSEQTRAEAVEATLVPLSQKASANGVATLGSDGVLTLAQRPAADTSALLAKANNLADVADASTSRTNLGIGTAGTRNDSYFDAAGLAATAQSNAATDATTKVATETSRATTAEGLAAQKSANLSDLTNVATARTNLGLGTASTHPSTDFDPAGSASTAQSSAATDATTKVATEASRAEGVEATLLSASDASVTNARTPTPHAPSHTFGGSDAVTLTEAQVTGLVSDLGAKANLSSLGGAALLNVGTTAGTVAAGDDPRFSGNVDGGKPSSVMVMSPTIFGGTP